MTATAQATYRCTVCGMAWSYEAVRHLACCRDCGSGLVRTLPALDEETWVASIEPPVDSPHRGEFSIVAEGVTEADALANLITASRAHAQ